MRKHSFLAAASAVLSLSGLAGCVSDNQAPNRDETLEIRTSPEMAAHCIVQSPDASWDVGATPEHIDVRRARGALDVSCQNALGWSGKLHVPSKISPIGIATAVAGGALAAGAVGATGGVTGPALIGVGLGGAGVVEGAQAIDGEAFIYPEKVVVPMVYNGTEIPPAIAHPAEPVVVAVPVVEPAPLRHRVVHHHARHAARCTCGS